MSPVAIAIIVVVVILAVFVVAGATWFALDSDRRIKKFARSGEIVPGQLSAAPASWAHSTKPEALLHQRLRYAIAAVHENPMIATDPAAKTARDDLDKAVVALDNSLVTLSCCDGDKGEDLDRIDAKVSTLQRLPGALWGADPAVAVAEIGKVATILRATGDVAHPPPAQD